MLHIFSFSLRPLRLQKGGDSISLAAIDVMADGVL